MGKRPCVTNGHARFPHPNPLPQAGEGDKDSLREFHNYEVDGGRQLLSPLITNPLCAEKRPLPSPLPGGEGTEGREVAPASYADYPP